MKAEILLDSINENGNRLTTFILEYPRFIHSEVLTHRVFSKNSASSRAIPFKKFVEQVRENPALPVFWGKNQAGMQATEELCDAGKYHAEEEWILARDSAIEHAENLDAIGVHKQIINRILEPWFNIRVILSGTEFENFFALRAHKDAQPELQKLAYLMLDAYNKSQPKLLKGGEWHIPFGDRIDENRIIDEYGLVSAHSEHQDEEITLAKMQIAVARVARVSYWNYDGKDDYKADVELFKRLVGSNPKHLSPTEHVAEAQLNSQFCGNFKGWKQYRKFIE